MNCSGELVKWGNSEKIRCTPPSTAVCGVLNTWYQFTAAAAITRCQIYQVYILPGYIYIYYIESGAPHTSVRRTSKYSRDRSTTSHTHKHAQGWLCWTECSIVHLQNTLLFSFLETRNICTKAAARSTHDSGGGSSSSSSSARRRQPHHGSNRANRNKLRFTTSTTSLRTAACTGSVLSIRVSPPASDYRRFRGDLSKFVDITGGHINS